MCPHATAKICLADSALQLKTRLKSIGTHPYITVSLCMSIHNRGDTSFLDNLPSNNIDVSDNIYCALVDTATEQDRIGFYPIFEGHISKNGNWYRKRLFGSNSNAIETVRHGLRNWSKNCIRWQDPCENMVTTLYTIISKQGSPLNAKTWSSALWRHS